MSTSKKRLAGLSIAVAALLAIGAMTWAWFTSTVPEITADVTTAKIQVTVDKNTLAPSKPIEWLPGQTATFEPLNITNNSTRNAVAKLSVDISSYLDTANIKNSGQFFSTTGETNKLYCVIHDAAWLGFIADEDDYLAKYCDIAGNLPVDQDLIDLIDFALANPDVTVDANVKPAKDDAEFKEFAATVKSFWAATIVGASVTEDPIGDFYDALKAKLDALNLAYITDADDNFYIALTSPTNYPAPEFTIPRTIEIKDIGYTLPESLGGGGSYGPPREDEQGSTISLVINLKAVQGTKNAVADVFGLTSAQIAALDAQLDPAIYTNANGDWWAN